MTRALSKFLFLIFVAFSSLAYSQGEEDSKAPPKQQEEAQGENFFDNVEAPVSYQGAFVKMMLTLLGLVALIVISVWMLRRVSHGRMKQMNSGRNIKILERRPLSAKSVLYLVEIGDKKVVIAESQLEVRPITGADQMYTSPD